MSSQNRTELKRGPPAAPGFFSVGVDIVITNVMQLILVATNILVIFTSFAYDGDNLGWIIFVEIVITYFGFGVYIRVISHHVIIYKRFYKKINIWHDNYIKKLKNGDAECCALKLILIKLIWWLYALFTFPGLIIFSIIQSYKYRKQQRSASNTDITTLDADNPDEAKQYWKMADTAYSISHLGVLSKQSSMIVCFIQDIPLFIISIIIVNYIGLIVYSISILFKFVCWFKHIHDVGKCTLYKYSDYLDHFGLRSVTWEVDDWGCSILIPIFYTTDERIRSCWVINDYVKVFDNDKDEWIIMVIVDIKRKNDSIYVINPINPISKDSKIYLFNRWEDDAIKPLTDNELNEYIKNTENTGNTDLTENTEPDDAKQITLENTNNQTTQQSDVAVDDKDKQKIDPGQPIQDELNDNGEFVDKTNNDNTDLKDDDQVNQITGGNDEYQIVSINDDDDVKDKDKQMDESDDNNVIVYHDNPNDDQSASSHNKDYQTIPMNDDENETVDDKL